MHTDVMGGMLRDIADTQGGVLRYSTLLRLGLSLLVERVYNQKTFMRLVRRRTHCQEFDEGRFAGAIGANNADTT